METLTHFIAGQDVPTTSNDYLDNFEPATGLVYSRIPEAGADELEAAIRAGQQAFPAWSGAPAEERAACLRRLARLIERDIDPLAMAESIDNGKPLSIARQLDIPRAAANLNFFAAAATQFSSESHATDAHTLNYTLRKPHGLVACISPWNLPLYLFTWKIAPALASGNCVIGKPSEVTPMTAWMLGKLCREAGLPDGVLNILHGSGPTIGQQIVEHPAISAISFTGGTATGEGIARTAAPAFKKLSLELGGKNPSIVFADCHWERMMDGVLRAAFSNQGQICLCGSRILLERSIYDRFCDEFVARVQQLRLGDPLENGTQQGAVVSEAHMTKILGCIETAREEGGTVLCGGDRVVPDGARCKNGWFVAPTVIEGLGIDCQTNQNEIFGPVVTLTPFDDEQQALELANGTRYGLAANLWSRDVDRCHRLAGRLDAGLIWINCWMIRDLRTPMGGMKHSGMGREGGLEAMRFFTEPRNVCVSFT
jgi:aminomuconate-semialdehyde/2-hydroxymuconate-6-semialdehyde dehydrogenase